MTTTRELRCVVCPMGCSLTAVQDEDGTVLSVTGNTCPRGKKYAESELTRPVRTLTTTVFTTDGRKVPVKTSAPIAKSALFRAMDVAKHLRVSLPVRRGDVLYADITEPGIDLVACKDMD